MTSKPTFASALKLAIRTPFSVRSLKGKDNRFFCYVFYSAFRTPHWNHSAVIGPTALPVMN
jgi:hypothetical protein